MNTISCTYAYHPANPEKKDLTLPVAVVKKYAFANPAMAAARSRHIDGQLEADIRERGILVPLTIKTNGQYGLLSDGYQRLGLAEKLGIKSVPVKIVPDNFRRETTESGFPPLEAKVKAWCDKNLLKHANHQISRSAIAPGGKGGFMGSYMGGFTGTSWVRCQCSCGASWKEEG